MHILKKVFGFAEIALAGFAAFLGISLLVGLARDNQFAGEWAFLLFPIEIAIAASFGWAGYALVTGKPRASHYQLIPAITIIAILALLVWSDSL